MGNAVKIRTLASPPTLNVADEKLPQRHRSITSIVRF